MQHSQRRGAAGSQYALIVGLVAVLAILAITSTGNRLSGLMSRTANTLQSVGNSSAVGGSGSSQPATISDLNSLTSANTSVNWNFSDPYIQHDFNIKFPASYWNKSASLGRFYYWTLNNTAMTATANFALSYGGTATLTTTGGLQTSVTPRGTSQTDNYLVFDFTGQMLNIPSDGIVWFHILRTGTSYNFKSTMNGDPAITDTYYQNGNLRAATSPSIFIEFN